MTNKANGFRAIISVTGGGNRYGKLCKKFAAIKAIHCSEFQYFCSDAYRYWNCDRKTDRASGLNWPMRCVFSGIGIPLHACCLSPGAKPIRAVQKILTFFYCFLALSTVLSTALSAMVKGSSTINTAPGPKCSHARNSSGRYSFGIGLRAEIFPP